MKRIGLRIALFLVALGCIFTLAKGPTTTASPTLAAKDFWFFVKNSESASRYIDGITLYNDDREKIFVKLKNDPWEYELKLSPQEYKQLESKLSTLSIPVTACERCR